MLITRILRVVTLLTALIIPRTLQNRPIFPIPPNYVEGSTNDECNFHSQLYRESLKNSTLWAYKIYDASAKSVTGHLSGNVFQFGNFDECLGIEAPFATQFCLVTVTAKVPSSSRDPFSINYSPYESVVSRIYDSQADESQLSRHESKIGLCLPFSCSPHDLEKYINAFLETVPKLENVTYTADVSEDLCQSSVDEKSFDGWDASFSVTTSVLLILPLISWIFRTSVVKKEEEAKHSMSLLSAFSPVKNYKTLFHVSRENTSLDALNGMRSLAIVGIIVLHRFSFMVGGALDNFDFLEYHLRKLYATFFLHADLLVESFFMFSAILVGYFVMVKKDMNNPFFAIFMRYARLTPTYAYFILYYTSFLYYIGSGPQWKKVILNGEIKDCRKNWWTNLLYINNYVNIDHMCIGQTWYLPCDFHFYIMGVLVMLMVKKNAKAGLSLLFVLFGVSMALPFVLTIIYEEPPFLYFFRTFLAAPKAYPYFRSMYVKSHNRATSYVIGLFIGYMYAKYKGYDFKLSVIRSRLLALSSLFLFATTMMSGAIFYDRYYKYNALEAGAYSALHKIPWCLGTAALFFSASHGSCSYIHKMLASSFWNPIAKLSFTAYLIHMQFPLRTLASSANASHFDVFNTACLGLGDVLITFFFSVMLYLLIEMPIQNVIKIVFLRQDRNEHAKKGALKEAPKDVSVCSCSVSRL